MARLRIILLAAIILSLHASAAAGETISPRLQQKLDSGDSTVPVLVFFRGRPTDPKDRPRTTASLLINELHRTMAGSQERALSIIAAEHSPVRRFWINNSLAATLSRATIQKLSALPEVENIDEDLADVFPACRPQPDLSFPAEAFAFGWNMTKLGIDSVWLQYGLDGSGVLIGAMDSGVDTTHPALRGHMPRGGRTWYDAVSSRPAPYDDMGHGTGTISVAVGGDGPGPFNQDLGVAFNARYIAAKMLQPGGPTPISKVVAAAQWMLDPDGNPATNDFPAVINNSWYSGTRGSTWFYAAAVAWYEAGIIPVFCAGNEGPAGGSTRSPGDYASCLSIGGTNSIDRLYAASSIGPSALGPEFPSDQRKPDFVAPGDGVPGATLSAGYGTMSGTSFAAPHAAGIIALMKQADSTLTFHQVRSILAQSAVDPGTAGFDYSYGYGRLDALKAIRSTLGLQVSIVPDAAVTLAAPGDSTTFIFSLRRRPEAPVTVVFDAGAVNALATEPPELIFSQADWNIPHPVTFRYASPQSRDTTVLVTAKFSSVDRRFNRILVADRRISVHKADTVAVGVGEVHRPYEFSLAQNYPNPFNPATEIRYTLPERSNIHLAIYNILGARIAVLADGIEEAGERVQRWNAGQAATGMYLYRLDAASASDPNRRFTQSKLMQLVK